MNRTKVLPTAFLLSTLATLACAGHPGYEKIDNSNIVQLNTLTDRLLAFNDALADKGIELELGLTQIYQQNVRGGISTHRRAGRFSGSYDLELSADLRKLLGIEGASLYMKTEGSYSNGINASSVGSFFGVNDDAAGNRSMDVTELWYEQAMFDDTFRVRVGKMDLTGGFQHRGCPVAFDCSAYANDETTQFLNSALVNNPTIPFPEYGLGVAVHYSPAESWYVSAAVADDQADVRETGFRTTFHDEDYFFGIAEVGFRPNLFNKDGTYRFMLWYDPQDKAFLDGSSRTERDDIGFAMSFDQQLTDKITGFFRYGWADDKVNEEEDFISFGAQIKGPSEARPDDIFAVGYAHGVRSTDGLSTGDAREIDLIEAYYRVIVNDNFEITFYR